MPEVKFHKVSALPTTLEPDSFYFVREDTHAEAYVTDRGGGAFALGNTAFVRAAVAESLSTVSNLQKVATIAARDSLALTARTDLLVLVADATGDTTVTRGAALYYYGRTDRVWTKVAEYESMDVTTAWEAISGRPNATPAQLDAAVAATHTHSNRAVLDRLSANADGLLFDGATVTSSWDTVAW